MLCLASQDLVCDKEFNHHYPPTLVGYTRRTQARRTHDATWCHYPLEFDLWHAWICCWILFRAGLNNQGPQYETQTVWIECRRMGYCGAPPWCPQGKFSNLFTHRIWLYHVSSRFLKMQLFFFHEALRTLRWSFQQWTTWMPILRRQLDTGSICMPFKRLSPLERKLLIVTMTRLINPKFSALLWVHYCFNILSITILTYILSTSTSSLTQTPIF